MTEVKITNDFIKEAVLEEYRQRRNSSSNKDYEMLQLVESGMLTMDTLSMSLAKKNPEDNFSKNVSRFFELIDFANWRNLDDKETKELNQTTKSILSYASVNNEKIRNVIDDFSLIVSDHEFDTHVDEFEDFSR